MTAGYDKFFKQAKKAKVQTPQGSEVRISPEKQIQAMLRKKALARRRAGKKRQRPPVFGLIVMAIGTSVAALGYFSPGVFDGLARHVQIGWLTSAIAETPPAEKSAATKDERAAKNSTDAKPESQATNTGKKSWTAEDISHISKLNERKKKLDLRETELNELEEELHKQKVEIEARIKKLEEIRAEISGALKDKVKTDNEKVGKLVDLYSNMKPKQAADVLSSLNEDLAVEILGRMKKKNAAEIMNLLKADKAQTLSEKYAGYKSK